MAEQPQCPLLTLPGELRNLIYTFVAHSTTSIKLHQGDLVPPPLANTCRQIRKEMSGEWYTQEVALDHTTPITAHLTNFDFLPLYKWLNTYDNRPAEQKKVLRVLDIELALVSPSLGAPTPLPSPFLAADLESSHGKDRITQLKARFTTDYRAILSCDSNWTKLLNTDLLSLGQATYGVTSIARANNPNLYTTTGRRRRFTETLAGNGYLTSCSTRVEFLHHPRVPRIKDLNNTNNINNTATTTTTTAVAKAAHPAFAHSTSYTTLLTTPFAPRLPTPFCTHSHCVRQLWRRITLGLLRAQSTSQKLKWDRRYYSSLSPEAKRVVRFYRLLDPLPQGKPRTVRAAFGAKEARAGMKRGVAELYAVGSGFGAVEEGYVDRAWVGCEKRRLWSPRGDDVPLEMAVGDGDAAVGAAAVSGASDGSEVKGFGDEVSGDDNEFIAGLMRRLGLGAR